MKFWLFGLAFIVATVVNVVMWRLWSVGNIAPNV